MENQKGAWPQERTVSHISYIPPIPSRDSTERHRRVAQQRQSQHLHHCLWEDCGVGKMYARMVGVGGRDGVGGYRDRQGDSREATKAK